MKLKKELGLFDVFSIAAGAMISSGLFILPGLAYLKVGPIVFIAYLLAGILVIPSLFCKAELATAMPKAGGDYFFINRSMGSGLGTIAGMAAWFSLAFKSAFALLGIGAFSTILFPSITYNQVKLIALFFCILFMFLNMVSARHSGKLQSILIIGLLIILTLFIIFGIGKVQLSNFSNFNRGSTRDLFATAGLIFISYSGLTKIASIAEEIKNPNKNLPLGMIITFIVVTLLYVLVVFITVGISGDKLINSAGIPSLTPISDAARLFSGNLGMLIMAVAALLAFISTGNAGIMAASRIPFAMSRDRLLPKFFSRINKEYQTPHFSIIMTVLIMVFVIIFLDLELLIKTASTISLILFAMINLAVIIMRESHIQNYQPKFRSPLYPWLQVTAIVVYGFLIFEMGSTPLLISSAFLIISYIWYHLYGKIRSNRESALLYLIRRIKSSELDSAELELELKEIILERDSIQQDRFDMIIEKCPILDMIDKESKEEFFARVAGVLNDSLTCGEREIYHKLISREEESSTVLTPILAIPHIILSGEKRFEILLARSHRGVYFSETAPAVKIIFVIAGSKDERQFHLKSLAAIAQIVQQHDFQEKWLNAQNVDSLRDIILLADRYRN
ncbi:MAG: amino acid permease [Candidatus Stygibacter australis]|nr:amino acid permease [Candidatus Stygibacter australis]MDP8322181.1 amino acid permease [Candidatus Stygibacter australis]